MTQEDILEMALEAGFEQLGPEIEDWICYTHQIERFARLVATAERDACAQIVELNADRCSNNTMLRDVLMGNTAAIRARGEE